MMILMMMVDRWVITRIFSYSNWCGLVSRWPLALLFHFLFLFLTLYQ